MLERPRQAAGDLEIETLPKEKAEFKKELSMYAAGKGTARFPLDKPIPFDLIRRIVKFRVKENLAGARAKGKKK